MTISIYLFYAGSVDDTAADLIRYKNFAEELRERRCNLHDLKAKLQDIEYEEDSGKSHVQFHF